LFVSEFNCQRAAAGILSWPVSHRAKEHRKVVRRTKNEAEETRSRILDAAEHMFSEHGVSRTSLEDIAQAAGVTRGAIYWHFKDKRDLFASMVDRVTLPMEAMVAASSDESVADPIASLKACAVSALKRTATDPQVQRVFDVVTHKCEYLGEMAGVNNRISAVQKGCVDRAEQAIRNAIKRGQLPATVNPRLAAIGLDAMLYGLISSWLANSSYLPLERQAEAMIDLYLGGLRVRRTKSAARAPRKAQSRRARRAA
jgi:TetR/AcrR family transcriptional regulator, acrAB operon repressor